MESVIYHTQITSRPHLELEEELSARVTDVYSAECTIGMVWGVGIAKVLWQVKKGNMALWHYGNKV